MSADTGAAEKAVVNADSLSAMDQEGERLQELFGDVYVQQDTTQLRSHYGLRYLNRDELLFTGDVVVYERGDTLRADTVWYNKRTKVGRARSNVRLTDGEVTVRAPRATYYTQEKRSVFPDSVTLVDSSRVLRAEEGTYWSDAQRAAFSGNVRLTDPTSYLEADSLTYFRDQERSIATGSVFSRRVETNENADTTSIAYLFGEWADNQEQNRYTRVEKQALLVRLRMDSTGAPEDTLAVRAQRLEAQRTDTRRRLVAVDSVRIWQADLAAVADSAVYDRVVGVGPPDTSTAPAPPPDPTGPPADSSSSARSRLDSLVAQVELQGPVPIPQSPPSAATTPSDSQETPQPEREAGRANTDPAASRPPDTSRRTAQARPQSSSDAGAADSVGAERGIGERWATPTIQSEEALPFEETRLFQSPITWFQGAQVWGDSIRVRARSRSLDTVFVREAAFAAQRDTIVDRIRQLKGKNITAFFHRNSLEKILARPKGQAIYFSSSEKDSLNGATRASADFAALHFQDEEVDQIKFGSGVQGTAYHKKKYIPDPFRLEGFQWTPERRPTRASVLREPRVRERLGLDSLERPPTERSPSVARARADSGRVGAASSPPETDSEAASRAPPRSEQSERRSLPASPDSLAAPVDSVGRSPDPSSSSTLSDTSKTFPPDP